jgi:hypothetical protein
VTPVYYQLRSLQAQLVKATYRTLNKSIVAPLTVFLKDAAKTLDAASSNQIDCSDLKPAVDALNQFNLKATSGRNAIDSLLGNGTTQSWLSQSNRIIKQTLLICQCSV